MGPYTLIKKPAFLILIFAFIGMLGMPNQALSADTSTTNLSLSEGLRGTDLLPTNFFALGSHCVGAGTASTGDQDNALACAEMAYEAVDGWLNGEYFNPRAGTKFIPPYGDSHRSGWRLMMQEHFSPGAFLTGFAPFLNQFPNFPQVGTPGPSGNDPDLLLLFLDHHGEPLTPGRFPRYIPHERQAWVDTLMVKFVSSTSGEFNQSLRSQVGGFRGDDTAFNTVTWMSMSDENADGCGAKNCIWTFNVGPDKKAGTIDDILSVKKDGGATEVITSSLRVSSFFAGGDGTVDIIKAFAPIEKVPTSIDDRLIQGMTQLGSPDGLQVLRYQIQVISGPNFHAEEGSDPYTWVICGSRTGGAGELDCDTDEGAAVDETSLFALVSGGGFGDGSVYDQSERFGVDGIAFTGDDGAGTDGIRGTSDDTIVACDGSGTSGYTDIEGFILFGADCDSDPGEDLVYGTSDDGAIYYKEAVENGFRGEVRENRAFGFSFIDSLDQLRQIMEQDIGDNFLMSCLNCDLPGLPPIGPLTYDQLFLDVPAFGVGSHPPNPSDQFDWGANP